MVTLKPTLVSFCHWNVNSFSGHNYAQVPLLQAFNTLHEFDLICLSETYLDSSISTEEKFLMIDGYKLLHADHPSYTKRDGVIIYHKESISVKVSKISKLPSQSQNCFHMFLNEKLLASTN